MSLPLPLPQLWQVLRELLILTVWVAGGGGLLESGSHLQKSVQIISADFDSVLAGFLSLLLLLLRRSLPQIPHCAAVSSDEILLRMKRHDTLQKALSCDVHLLSFETALEHDASSGFVVYHVVAIETRGSVLSRAHSRASEMASGAIKKVCGTVSVDI